MKLFQRIKSPSTNSVVSGGDSISSSGSLRNKNNKNAGNNHKTITTAIASSAGSSTVTSISIPDEIPTNVQVVARIRPVIVNNLEQNQSFFHVKSPPSRRRRLIGLKGSIKKDNKSSSATTASTSTLSSPSAISDKDIVVAWDLVDGDTVKQSSKTEQIKGRTNSYTLDRVFGTASSTSQIYDESVKPLVISAMKGYHSTILAYGQTSTGKTHTMSGTTEDPGLVPLAIQECFRLVKDGTLDKQQTAVVGCQPREYLFRLSYLEVYKEHIRDLLAPTPEPVRLFDGPNGLMIRGLKEEVVTTPEQVFELLRKGEKRRSVGATNMNQHSSRSHAMVRLWIESSIPGEKSSTRVSSLSLVDLAGSESVRLNGSERREEGHYINKSLMTLGQVVLSLSDASSAVVTSNSNKKKDVAIHVPYRDSKLTRLLQPSLSGNAQMVLLCCISPLASHLEESHNTLKFATRAKRIEQRAAINTVEDNEETLLQTYREEIEDLKKQLREAEEQRRLLEARAEQAELDRQESKEEQTATTPPNVSRAGSTIETATDEINELVEAIQSMEQLILKSRPQSEENFSGKVPDSQTKKEDTSMIDISLARLLEQDEGDDDGSEEFLLDDMYHSLSLKSPASTPTSKGAGRDQRTEDALHTELTRIRELLGSVLQKRGVPTTSMSNLPRRSLEKDFSTPPATPLQDENGRLNSTTDEVESLRKQLEHQQRSTNLRKADSSFLQSQLKEKEELLIEVSQLLEAVEKRQNELEDENADLKQRLTALLNERVEL